MKKIEKYYNNLKEFIDFLKTEKLVYIQPHNFPDHDSVASAFAMQDILKKFGINSEIIYDGEIQRNSLKDFIERLGIEIKNILP